MELWDVYDKNRKPMGYKIVRGGDRRLGKNEYHVTAHVCVFSSNGEMLIQKRTSQKALWGGLWDISAGGSVLSGETSGAGASRELLEELGISADFSKMAPRMTLYHRECISDYYTLVLDVQPQELNIGKDEVSDVRYASVDEILSMINGGSFVPYRESVIRMIFDMRLRGGAW